MKGPSNPESHIHKLNEAQRRTYDAVLRGESVFFTGPGGTGKSFTINAIQEALFERNIKFAVTASTGAASERLNDEPIHGDVAAMTLHKWSGCGVFFKDAVSLAADLLRDPKKRRSLYNWTSVKVLIIDEISMISASVFEKLEEVARLVLKNNKPFGGIQVVISGDFAQLPPVEPVGGFCFQSKMWRAVIPLQNQILLTDVIRQADIAFSTALSEIRMGIVSSTTIAMLNSRVGAKVGTDMIKPTVLYPRRIDVANANRDELAKIHHPSHPYKAIHKFIPYGMGKMEEERHIAKANDDLQCRALLELKVGAQVMCIVNMKDSSIVNGSRGVVIGFDSGDATNIGSNMPIVQFMKGPPMIMQLHKWRVKIGDAQWMERLQVPLILAWSLTIHKIQGATLDCAEIDLTGNLQYGQGYVALSRVRDLSGLSLRGRDLSQIRVHPDVKKFYTELSAPIKMTPVATVTTPKHEVIRTATVKAKKKPVSRVLSLKDMVKAEDKKRAATEDVENPVEKQKVVKK